jgi:hypothetical protein
MVIEEEFEVPALSVFQVVTKSSEAAAFTSIFMVNVAKTKIIRS